MLPAGMKHNIRLVQPSKKLPKYRLNHERTCFGTHEGDFEPEGDSEAPSRADGNHTREGTGLSCDASRLTLFNAE